MGQYRFWYEHENTRFVIDVDRIGLDWTMGDFVETSPAVPLAERPKLIDEWVRADGWCGTDDHTDSIVDYEDIRAFAVAVRLHVEGRLSLALDQLVNTAETLKAPMGAMID